MISLNIFYPSSNISSLVSECEKRKAVGNTLLNQKFFHSEVRKRWNLTSFNIMGRISVIDNVKIVYPKAEGLLPLRPKIWSLQMFVNSGLHFRTILKHGSYCEARFVLRI